MNEMAILSQLMIDEQMESKGENNTEGVWKRIPKNWILVLKSGVAGMQFHMNSYSQEQKAKLLYLDPGTELILERDYQNKHDQWAIGIYSPEKEMLGYMTRYKNETIARLMDYGKLFHAIVDKPADPLNGEEEIKKIKTPTENFALPYSVYMEE